MNKKYSLFKTSACIFLLVGLSVGYAASTCYTILQTPCVTAGKTCWAMSGGVLSGGIISDVTGVVSKCSVGSPGKTECATNQVNNIPCKYTCTGYDEKTGAVKFKIEANTIRSSDGLQGEDCEWW